MTEQSTPDGIQLDLIAGSRLDGMRQAEKISTILDSVDDGKIVVLEAGLTPDEQSKLVEVTMSKIQPDSFNGIEIESYPDPDSSNSFVEKLFGTGDAAEMTVIGPANRLETLHKDESLISAIVSQ